jgi:transcription antitermination factor NusG
MTEHIPMSAQDLKELERNIETRVKLDMLSNKVDDLKKTVEEHMLKEECERKAMDKKLFYLFLLATGQLGISGGPEVLGILAKLFG